MKLTKVLVLSKMNKQTGIYENILVMIKVNNFECIESIKSAVSLKDLISIEIFALGRPDAIKIYHSIEEFEENELNI